MWRAKMVKKAVAAPMQNAEIFIVKAKIRILVDISTTRRYKKLYFYELEHEIDGMNDY
jgi:hypothetical protein